MVMERRFGALRVISMILKILAWVALIAGVVAAVGLFLTSGRASISPDGLPQIMGSGLGTGLLSLAMGILYFILFYAFAESILVFVDIEENTRATAILLRDQYGVAGSAAPVVQQPVVTPVVQQPVEAPRRLVEQEPLPPVPPVRQAPPPAAPPPMPPGRQEP